MCYPVIKRWFEEAKAVTVQWVMNSGKQNLYWNVKESSGLQSAVGIV